MGSVAVLGATGLLGQALLAEASRRGLTTLGVARKNTGLCLDLARDPVGLESHLTQWRPALVINAAAQVSLDQCEKDPATAYLLHAALPGRLAELSRTLAFDLIQISTDHFFTGDGNALHDEHAPVQLVNEYARSKFAGEALALTSPRALVIRTNLAGFRGWPQRPSFVEWLAGEILARRSLTLYTDYVTSTMPASTLARAILDLARTGARGLLNVASREASSKAEFALALARALEEPLSDPRFQTVERLLPRRAESLGLDVSRAEARLGWRLPTLEESVRTLAAECRALSEAPNPESTS